MTGVMSRLVHPANHADLALGYIVLASLAGVVLLIKLLLARPIPALAIRLMAAVFICVGAVLAFRSRRNKVEALRNG
jgi:hypothetical protein